MHAPIARIRRVNSRFKTNTIISSLITLLSISSTTQIVVLQNFSQKCLIGLARHKKNDNLTFFVGLRLFVNSNGNIANELFKEVTELDKLTPRALHFIARCASWVSDVYNLERIRKQLGPTSSIGLFAGALINHTLNPELSIVNFNLVEQAFLGEQKIHTSILSYPEYVKTSMNVMKVRNANEADSGDNQVTTLMNEQKQFSNTPIHDIPKLIIISVTLPYLLELAGIVVKRIRRRHEHPIMFIVVATNDLEAQVALDFLRSLSEDFLNIYWQAHITPFDTPNISSVARFLVSQYFFDNNNCQSILILDVDTSFVKSDPIQIWDQIGDDFAIGVITHKSFSPWERLSLGLTILNRNEFTGNFLYDLKIHVTDHFVRGRAFWTLDQTAAYFVISELLVTSGDTLHDCREVLDLSKYITIGDLTFLDPAMRRGKMRAKMKNESFVQELREKLFFD